MNRNTSKQALVLSVKENAQDNRTVCLLTKDGIEYSTLYGGPKSKMRGAVSPWNCGTVFLYCDAAKGTSKISDFDVKKYHPTFRENLFKSFAASLASEVTVRSKCAGSPEMAWLLLNGFLDGMDLCDEEESRRGLVRFLWRYIDLLGVRPSTEKCARCGREFSSSNFNQSVIQSEAGGNSYALYSAAEGGFVCDGCHSAKESGERISFNSLFYLTVCSGENFRQARKLTLSQREFSELKSFVYQQTENALGFRLKTLNSGGGIL